MKRFIAVIVICFFCCNFAYADMTDELDYDFINNAFTNPKPTPNQDFERLMKEYEKPKKEGFFTKVFKYFDSDKVKYDEEFKKRYENPNNQPARIKDVPEEKPTVLITADAVDSFGNIVKSGYYQIIYKNDDGKYKLELTEGSNRHVATIIARTIKEDEDAPSVVYSRAKALDNGFIKIIYSNLDLTLAGYLKITSK